VRHRRHIHQVAGPGRSFPFLLNLTVCALVRSCTRTHTVHLPPWPGHSYSTRLSSQSVPVYPYTLTASSSLAWPLVPCSAQPDCLLTCTSVPVHNRCVLLPGLVTRSICSSTLAASRLQFAGVDAFQFSLNRNEVDQGKIEGVKPCQTARLRAPL